MPIAVGTNVRMAYSKETVRGTTDSSANSQIMRVTGRNINLKKDLLESNEVSSTRQRVDVRHGFNRVEGEIGFELSLDSFNGLIALAMGRDTINGATGWTDNGAAITSLGVQNTNSSAGTFELFKASTSFIESGYRPGDWVTISGFTGGQASANGDMQVVSVGTRSTTGYMTIRYTGTAPTDGGTTGSVVLKGKKLTIGSTLKTISIQRAFSDIPMYQYFYGCTINTMSMTIRPDAIVGGTMGFLGISADIDSGSAFAPGTTSTFNTNVSPALANPPFSAFDGSVVYGGSVGFLTGTVTASAASVGATSITANAAAASSVRLKKGDFITIGSSTQLYQVQADATIEASNNGTVSISPAIQSTVSGGAAIAVNYTASTATITALDFTLDNQRSLLGVVGSKFSSDIYEGVAKVTGTVSMLLSSQAQLTMFESELTPIMLSIRLNDLGGSEFMSITFYRAKLTSADIDPPQNGPVIQVAQFEALEQTFVGTNTFKEVMSIQRSTTTAAGTTTGWL